MWLLSFLDAYLHLVIHGTSVIGFTTPVSWPPPSLLVTKVRLIISKLLQHRHFACLPFPLVCSLMILCNNSERGWLFKWDLTFPTPSGAATMTGVESCGFNGSSCLWHLSKASVIMSLILLTAVCLLSPAPLSDCEALGRTLLLVLLSVSSWWLGLHGVSGSLEVNRTLFISTLSHSLASPPLMLCHSKLTFFCGLVRAGSSRRCCPAWHTLPLLSLPCMHAGPRASTRAEGTDSSRSRYVIWEQEYWGRTQQFKHKKLN